MWDKARNYALISVLALLIWVWAETESLTNGSPAPRIEFVEGKSNLVPSTPDRAWQGTVRVSLRGSTGAIDAANRVLADVIRLQPGSAALPAAPGEHTVDLRLALRDLPELKRLGVNINAVDPPTVRVVLQALTTRVLPVRVRLTDVQVEGEPIVTPPTVEVRLPAALATRLGENATAAALIDSGMIADLSADATQVIDAAVTLPEGFGDTPNITLNPRSVQVALRLKSRIETITLPSIPVWIAMPPIETGKWDVEVLDPFLKNITVTGPSDLVRPLKAPEGLPTALVTLTSDDLEKRIESKQAVFNRFPTTLQFRADSTTIRLKITPRKPEKPPQ